MSKQSAKKEQPEKKCRLEMLLKAAELMRQRQNDVISNKRDYGELLLEVFARNI
jgi:hypothetical protein